MYDFFVLSSQTDTIAFQLEESGYSSLFHNILLQDVLSRVHNYRMYQRFSKSEVRDAACARLFCNHCEIYIQSSQFLIGGITRETFQHFQHMNPAIEEFICSTSFTYRCLENIGGVNLVVVDNHIPLFALNICWVEQKKQWCAHLLSSQVAFQVNEQSYTMNDGEVPLGEQARLLLGNTEILFSSAC